MLTLAAPILVLADQSIAYATSGWACSHQNSMMLHVVHGAFLAACVVGAPAVARTRTLPPDAEGNPSP